MLSALLLPICLPTSQAATPGFPALRTDSSDTIFLYLHNQYFPKWPAMELNKDIPEMGSLFCLTGIFTSLCKDET